MEVPKPLQGVRVLTRVLDILLRIFLNQGYADPPSLRSQPLFNVQFASLILRLTTRLKSSTYKIYI